MDKRTNAARVAFILNYFPVLSETFIFSELDGLFSRHIDLEIFSLFRKSDNSPLQDAGQLGTRTTYLSDYTRPINVLSSHLVFMFSRPVQYFKTLAFAVRNGNPGYVFGTAFKYLVLHKGDRKKIPYNVRQDLFIHFVLAVPFARVMMKKQFSLIHGHFADAATSFAMLISKLCNIPFSFTTHATDLFVRPVLLPLKVKNAKFVLTCTEYNKNYIVENIKDIPKDKVILNYHGVAVEKFLKDTKQKNTIPVIFTVGRLVEKKGFDVLMRACKILKEQGIEAHCRIAGQGPLWDDLHKQSLELGLEVDFLGAVSHQEMKDLYQNADIFALPCRVAENGDRDGIPNVIAEAMAMELPVVSTCVSGIPEVIESGKSGFLVDSNDPVALAQALKYLIENPEIRNDIGKRARDNITSVFNKSEKIDELVEIFRKQLGE